MNRTRWLRCTPAGTLADRMTRAISRLAAKPEGVGFAMVDANVQLDGVTSDVITRGTVAVVECTVPMFPLQPLSPHAVRRSALSIAHIHAMELRGSHADMTNLRELNGADLADFVQGPLYAKSTASLHDEKFATVEYKVHRGGVTGPIVVWGAAVFRLWSPIGIDSE